MMDKKNSIMLLATQFDNLGGWTVEQQFVLQMGSSYLLAHGIGTPIAEDPTTKVKIEKAGRYTLWVRTKNWTAFWSEGKTPGIFQVKVDGVADEAEFGIGCKALHVPSVLHGTGRRAESMNSLRASMRSLFTTS